MLFRSASRRARFSQISMDRRLRSAKLTSLSRCLIDFLNRDFSEKFDPGFAIFSRLNHDSSATSFCFLRIPVVPRSARNIEHRVSLKPGKGWLQRNFITQVYLPSLFTRRKGTAHLPEFPELAPDDICLTWIGHSSFLIQWRGLNIVVDPIWSLWLKIVKRIRRPGFPLKHLPAIDLVLVTH